MPHDVRVENAAATDLGGTEIFTNGMRTVDLQLNPGTYTFAVGGHRAAGMEGTLTVNAPGGSGTIPTPPPTHDASAVGKQKVKKLKIDVTSSQDSSVEVGGQAKVPTKGGKKGRAAKTKKYELKEKTVALQAGVTETIRLKFTKHKRSVKKIVNLLDSDKKARKRSKVVVDTTASNAAGTSPTETTKIKLKG